MSNKVRLHAASHVQNLRQAYALLLLGIICLLAAWLLHPDTRIHSDFRRNNNEGIL